MDQLILGLVTRCHGVSPALERADEQTGVFLVRDGSYLDHESSVCRYRR